MKNNIESSPSVFIKLPEWNFLFKAIAELVFLPDIDAKAFLTEAYSIITRSLEHSLNLSIWIDIYGELYGVRDRNNSSSTLKWNILTPIKKVGEFGVDLPKHDDVVINPTELKQLKEHFDIISHIIGMSLTRIADITNVQSTEKRYRDYFENAPLGVVTAEYSGKFVDINSTGTKLLGYSRDELVNLSIENLLVPEDTDSALCLDESFKKGKSGSHEISLYTKDGNILPVTLDSVSLSDGTHLAFFRDISVIKKLESSFMLFNRAIETLIQPVLITSLEGAIIEVNEAFCRFYGFSKKEITGKNPRILNAGRTTYLDLSYSIEDYEEIFRDLWKSITDPSIGRWRGTVINRKKNRSLVWVDLVINTIFDDKGKAIGFVGMPIDISDRISSEEDNKIQLFSTIASLADLRDDETGNHMKRVGVFAKLLATSLGKPNKYCDDIMIFAPMHDIGKVGILDAILKAERKLTIDEFDEMKKHTTLGYNIVKGKKELEMVAAITLNHHEKWDGTGYPNGVKGEDIPQSARITAVADIYDALRSKRPYKEPWTHQSAVNEIIKLSGSHLDPEIVDKFILTSDLFENVYQQLSDT